MRIRGCALVLMAGCCTTEIATTTAESAACLRVWPHHDSTQDVSGRSVHLRGVVLDGTRIPIGPGTTTLRTAAGEHRLAGDFEDCLHWPGSWFRDPANVIVNQDGGGLVAEAGQTYELACRRSWNSGPRVRLEMSKK